MGEVRIFDAAGRNVAETASLSAKDTIKSGVRWGIKNLTDGKFATGGDPAAMARLAVLKDELRVLLGNLETPERVERRKQLSVKLETRNQELSRMPQGKRVYAIATHFKKQGNVIPTEGKPRTIHLLHRGDLRTPGDVMQPGAPALWPGIEPVFALPENHTEGDRRVALADYLTHPQNPLLWRSIANRVWLYHLGRGIVDSPNDFGRMGMEPTHPELLDWLAARLRETESLKDLHRLIVTSSTYRQSSASDPGKAGIDGDNAFYWRMDRRKLQAEELRDSVLAVTGKLDPRMGGPSFQDFKFEDDHTPKYWYHLHDPTSQFSLRFGRLLWWTGVDGPLGQ